MLCIVFGNKHKILILCYRFFIYCIVIICCISRLFSLVMFSCFRTLYARANSIIRKFSQASLASKIVLFKDRVPPYG